MPLVFSFVPLVLLPPFCCVKPSGVVSDLSDLVSYPPNEIDNTVVIRRVGVLPGCVGSTSADGARFGFVGFGAHIARFSISTVSTCHNDRAKTAGLMLDKMDLDHVGEGAETWEKVVRKLRGGMMPPHGPPTAFQ